MALHGKVKQMKRIQATPRCAHALINCNTLPSAAFLRFLQARLCRSLCHRRGRQVVTHIISTQTRPKPCTGALIFHPWTGLCSSIAPTPLRHTSIALDVRRRHQSQASSCSPALLLVTVCLRHCEEPREGSGASNARAVGGSVCTGMQRQTLAIPRFNCCCFSLHFTNAPHSSMRLQRLAEVKVPCKQVAPNPKKVQLM